MHIEVLVEDSSGEKLLQCLLPKLLGPSGETHTWRMHSYKGIGRIPKDLAAKADPAKRILLDRLPKLLRGYGNTPGIDAVVVLLDVDRRNCKGFLKDVIGAQRVHQLPQIPRRCAAPGRVSQARQFGVARAACATPHIDSQSAPPMSVTEPSVPKNLLGI